MTARIPRLPGRRAGVSALAPVLGVALLCGCSVGPDFVRPAAPEVDRYTREPLPVQGQATPVPGGEAQTIVVGGKLPPQWWRLFASEKLNALVDQAFAGSPTLAAAQATLRQAQENLNADYGALFPTVDARFAETRQKTNGAAFGNPAFGTNIFNLYNASIPVSYGVDVFGGVRRALEAQKATVEFQNYELQATYQTLAANVVTSAIAEASLTAQLAATRDILAAQERQLSITERQFNMGGVAGADVLSARSNLAVTRTQVPALEKQLQATQNQLAVYLGKFPSQRAEAGFTLEELSLPRELPLTLPSELVNKRPDVRAAEAVLHQASAQIGVATAQLLPQITLSASLGSEVLRYSELFKSSVWSAGATVTQPLIHGGALFAHRRAAIAAYDQALANYRQTVLTAFQNVANALAALDADSKALQAQYDADTAAESSLTMTERQFKLGGVGYPSLLLAQRQHQQARISYLQALASRYQDTAALFQALGGDLAALQTGTTESPAAASPVASAEATHQAPAGQ